MKTGSEMLEDHLEKYEEHLGRLNSYLKELNAMTGKHGTDKSQFDEDLLEAEHNIKYYEGEIARIKEEMGKKSAKAAPQQTGTDTILPRTAKQGIGSLILSSISFVAGAFLGSKLKSRKAGKDGPEKRGR